MRLATDRDALRARGFAWALLLGFAAGVRVLAWTRSAVLFDDGPIFLSLARAAASGQWSDVVLHPYHPLYPLASALGASLLGDLELGAVAVSIVAGVASVALVRELLKDGFDDRIGWLGGWLWALHPLAIDVGSDVLSDGLYLALFLAAVLALWRGLARARPALAATAGLAAGAAYLCRPEGLVLVPLGGALALGLAAAGRWSVAQSLRFGLALAVTAASIASPYVVALKAETGAWTLTRKKPVASFFGIAAEAPNARPRSPLETAAALPRASDAATGVPRDWPARVRRAVSELYRASVSAVRPELLPFLLCGLIVARGRPRLRGAFVLTLVGGYTGVLLGLGAGAGYVSNRHVLPLVAVALGYPALGLLALGQWFAEALRAAGPRVGLVLALALAAVLLLPRQLEPRRAERLAVRRAAEWLRARDVSHAPVAAGRPRDAYYAGARFVPLPSDPPEGMVPYLRRHGVRYVIVDEGKLDEHLGLRAALDEGLELLHRSRARGRNAAVYQVETENAAQPAPGGAQGGVRPKQEVQLPARSS